MYMTSGLSSANLMTDNVEFAYFFFHTLLRTHYLTRQIRLTGKSTLSTPAELSLGAAAGAFAQIFTIPVAVIATRQQLWVPPSASSTTKEPSFVDTAKEVIAEGGVTALWTGLRPGLVLTVNPAITYGVFERLKSWRLSGERVGGKLGVMEAFYIGVLSKTLATIVTYPYIFVSLSPSSLPPFPSRPRCAKSRLVRPALIHQAKVRLQARPVPAPIADQTSGTNSTSFAAIAAAPPSADSAVVAAGEADKPVPGASQQPARPAKTTVDHHKGAIALLAAVYKEKGLAGWYQGLGAQITKAVLCQGGSLHRRSEFCDLTGR